MKKNLKLTCFLIACFLINNLVAQDITQTIRGTVIDLDTRSPLIGANVVVEGSDPVKGAVTNIDGSFRIENVNIGRINLKITFLGYEDRTIPNVLIGAAKEVVLNIE